MRVLTGDDFEKREGRAAEEALVGIDLDIFGMIDGEKARLIEVIELFHGLEHFETDEAVARLHLIAGNFEIFVGVGSVALVRAGPVADDAGADHVGEEFEFFAVPDEDDRAGTAATVDFGDLSFLWAGICISSCRTPVGQSRRMTSASRSEPRPATMSVGP